ncbi:hypothetical protein COV22_01175, partial [Candidatus Woesearchaeota archaeon CG10_big_fil_rev_8_21_14_0_10_47_5]
EESCLNFPYVYDVDKDVEGKDPKRALELLGVPHVVKNKKIIVEGEDAVALSFCLNEKVEGDDVLDIINRSTGIMIRDKNGTFIGARMGRPEKAKMRKMTGNPHGLFPVGDEGGKMRNLQCSLEKGKVTAEFSIFYCDKCKQETIYPCCEICGNKTTKKEYCQECEKYADEDCLKKNHRLKIKTPRGIDVKHYFKYALKGLGIGGYPEMVKGIRGMSSEESIPENLIKG